MGRIYEAGPRRLNATFNKTNEIYRFLFLLRHHTHVGEEGNATSASNESGDGI